MIKIDIKLKEFNGITILKDLKLELRPHECLALLGPSGIGKTTFLRIVAGLDKDFKGTRNVSDKIAYVFQEPTLLDWRTALENITLIADVADATAMKILEELGLKGREGHYPQQLSLGQQRRLALARAFAVEPELLIMDEPYASLDEELANEMLALTKNLIAHKKMTALFVTHSQKEADFLSTRVLKMEGTPAKFSSAHGA